MGNALLAGIAAGLAVAVPLGAIGVLIVELGARGGFRAGFSAGLGTALCDGTYAIVAVVLGAGVSEAPGRWETEIAIVAAVVLALVGLHLLRGAWRVGAAPVEPERIPGHLTLRFLALTAINPLTATIFAGLITGDRDLADGATGGAVFAAGVFVTSLVWQSGLAGAGAVLHHRLPLSAQRWTRALAAVLVLALALRTALAA